MYLNTYGGSALLHLLIGYPRLVLVFGLAGLVGMTSTPLGPGRYSGTGAYLAQLDSAFKPRLAEAAAEQRARQAAIDMLERLDDSEILAAVEHTLQQCGPGCTDVATPIVIDDPEKLLDWRDADRAIAVFADARDVRQQERALGVILDEWIAQTQRLKS